MPVGRDTAMMVGLGAGVGVVGAFQNIRGNGWSRRQRTEPGARHT